MIDVAKCSDADRTVMVNGMFSVWLTDQELILACVAYKFKRPVSWDRPTTMYASPEEVLDATDCRKFQISEYGYRVLAAKAERLIELRKTHGVAAKPKGKAATPTESELARAFDSL